MRFHIVSAAALLACACSPPSPQPQPDEIAVVDGTRVENPVAPGALDNESADFPGGNVTPADRNEIYDVEPQSASSAAMNFARLLAQRQFEDAYRMWAPQAADFTSDHFASQFDKFQTINAAVRRNEERAAAGRNRQQIQLTISGETRGGENYALTGPLMLARTDGAGETPGRWQVVRLVLTANPRAADQLIDQ
jgi:hypothetical protein